MSEENQDLGVGRVIEVSGLVKIFLSLMDELMNRGFSRNKSLEIAERFLINVLGYKASMDIIDEEAGDCGHQIVFFPADGSDPSCQNI